MKYHPFHPTVDGKKRWGYYFTSEGKDHQVIVHPRTGKPFATRKDVERWLDELRSREVEGSDVTMEEISKFLFAADGPWAERQTRRRDGRPLSKNTIYEHQMNVRRHIVPAIGKERVADVDTLTIDELLYSLDLSNRTRWNVASTLTAIFKEAVRRRIIRSVPMIELPQKKTNKPNILTLEELRKLFPRDRQALQKVWGPPGKTHGEPPEARLALAACSATMFFGGLRPQEARAVGPGQLHRDSGILLVTRSMDAQDNVQSYVKMGNDKDPRYRGTLLIDWALEVMDPWLEARPPDEDLLFTYRGEFIRKDLLLDRLRVAIKNAAIPTEGKRFIPYSGRYTFNTTLKPFLPAAVLMTLMGHVDAAMPERYDVPVLLERMRQLAPYRTEISRAIGDSESK